MSLIVESEGQELWSPSLQTGRLFEEQVRALERLTGMESGVSPIVSDEIRIDAGRFRVFVESCLQLLAETNNGPLYAMSAGSIQVIVALYRRLFHQSPPAPGRTRSLVSAADRAMQPLGGVETSGVRGAKEPLVGAAERP
jgi:hypothetical protein